MKKIMSIYLTLGVLVGMGFTSKFQKPVPTTDKVQIKHVAKTNLSSLPANTARVPSGQWLGPGATDNPDSGWVTYGDNAMTYLTWAGPRRATYFDPADFAGVGYPITIDTVRTWFYQHSAYPWAPDTIFKFMILDGDGATVIDTSPWFHLRDTLGVQGPIVWALPTPITRNAGETWYVVVDPTVNGQTSGHPSTLADGVPDGHSFAGDLGSWSNWPYGEFFIDCFIHYTPPPDDVGAKDIVSPTGTIENGATITPSAWFQNYGGNTETFTVYMNIYQEDMSAPPVYTSSRSVLALAPGDSSLVNFDPWTVPSYGRYFVEIYTVLAGDVSPANDTMVGTAYAVNMGHDVLILDFDGGLFLNYPTIGHSPTGVANALQALGHSIWYDATGAYFNRDSMNMFGEVWMFLGQYPYNASITSLGGAIIDSFLLADGGRMFLEGGDCWYYDPLVGYWDPNPTFGTQALADGANDLDTIWGVSNSQIPSVAGHKWWNSAFNNWVDHIDTVSTPPNGGSGDRVLYNQQYGYYAGISYDQGGYKTFASSGTMGGYANDTIPVDSLVGWIYDFLSPQLCTATCGDVNNDGFVDGNDASYLANYANFGGPAPNCP